MKQIINDKQLQTIKYELNYYSQYCDNELQNKIKQYLNGTTDEQLILTISSLKRDELNDLLLYFYLL